MIANTSPQPQQLPQHIFTCHVKPYSSSLTWVRTKFKDQGIHANHDLFLIQNALVGINIPSGMFINGKIVEVASAKNNQVYTTHWETNDLIYHYKSSEIQSKIVKSPKNYQALKNARDEFDKFVQTHPHLCPFDRKQTSFTHPMKVAPINTITKQKQQQILQNKNANHQPKQSVLSPIS